MEFIRELSLQEQKYRWRMYAMSTVNFIPIKHNKFLERKKNVFTDRDAHTCNCLKTKKLQKVLDRGKGKEFQSFNCEKYCLNRSLNIECSNLTCPCGNYCQNRHFQAFQDRFVYPIKTSFKGWGLAAGEFIPNGSFVM